MKKEYVSQEKLHNGKITAQLAKEWLQREQSLLINAQTGTGKTTSLMNAALQLATQNELSEYYIFTAPTVNLCEQIAQNHPNGTILLTGSVKRKEELINQHIGEGNRVFITTYDQAEMLVSHLKLLNNTSKYNLIIDEYHRLIADYNKNFRKKTMASLYKLQQKAKSVIALSGTPQLILLDSFDSLITVERSAKPLFNEFSIVSFPKKMPLAKCLLPYIYRRVNDGHKVIVFLQSVKRNKALADKLNENSISAINIDSSIGKDNDAYRSIVELGRFPENIDVIFTTSLLAEGISINIEEHEKIEVIVVAHKFSNFFSPLTIEQISNRIRQPYARFSIFTENPSDFENCNSMLYNYEQKFRSLKIEAQNSKQNLIEMTNRGTELTVQSISSCERNAYLALDGKSIVIDELAILNDISKDSELYYKSNRHAFIAALSKQFPHYTMSCVDYDLDSQFEVDTTKENISISDIPLSQRFTDQDFELLQKRQKQFDFYLKNHDLEPAEKRTLKALLPYTSCYNLLIKLAENFSSTQVNLLIDTLNGYVELQTLKRTNNTNFTLEYVQLIAGEVGDNYFTVKELKMLLHEAHKQAICLIDGNLLPAEKMQKIYFFKREKRTNSKRLYSLELHTPATIAAQFNLTNEEVANLLKCTIKKNKVIANVDLIYLLLAS